MDEATSKMDEATARLWDALSQDGSTNGAAPEQATAVSAMVEELRVAQEELVTQHEELFAAHEALRRERERYHDLFDNAPFGYVVTDDAGRIQEANFAAVDLLNRAPADLRNKSIFVYLPVADRSAVRRRLLTLRSTGRPQRYDTATLRRDDKPVPVEVRLSAADKEGGVGWMLVDLTERHRAEQLEIERLDLIRSNEIKDQFMGLISHELRTPLTIVYGNATLLARRRTELSEEDQAKSVEEMERESHQLIVMVENMLSLTRPSEAGEMELLLLQHVAPSLVSQAGRRLGERQLNIEVQPDLPPVLGSPPHIVQILENYLRNAEKYSPSDAPIDVRVAKRNGRAAFMVLDRGEGIPADERNRLFQPFFRSRTVRGRVRGMGLGLAVCKLMADIQDGEVFAEPREGGGSVFGLSLPFSDITPL